ncbi:MAG: phage virion morphogenesis protein [Candidatus Eremiobacteraeota bacterium]|nr:phage virion morphogenesis protein [Candidatus Eremiobacteraeota bacterium]
MREMTFGEFEIAIHRFGRAIASMHTTGELKRAIEDAVEPVRDETKAAFGKYQDAAGRFPAWAPLADATNEDRARRGYERDKPLERSGALRESYETGRDDDDNVILGSKLPYAAPQELGNRHVPQRSALGIGFVRKERVAFARLLDRIEARIQAQIRRPMERLPITGGSAIDGPGRR